MKPVTLCAIDLETSSLVKTKCEIREIALVPLDADTFRIRDDVPEYVQIARCEFGQDPGSFDVHKIPAHEGIGQAEMCLDLVCFLASKWGVSISTKPSLMLLGHNLGVFDIPVLSRVMGEHLYDTLFHYRIRDSSILARAWGDAGWFPADLREGKLHAFCKALGMPAGAGEAHRALPDARDEATLYRLMIEQMQAELNQAGHDTWMPNKGR